MNKLTKGVLIILALIVVGGAVTSNTSIYSSYMKTDELRPDTGTDINITGNLVAENSSSDITGFDDVNATSVYADGTKLTKTVLSVCDDNSCDYVTDGTCDDVQIQAALDAAYSGGKSHTVFIRGGTYNLCQPLDFRYNHNVPVILTGEGGEATTLSWAASPVGIYVNNTNYAGGVYQGAAIKHLKLYGNGTGTAIKNYGTNVQLSHGYLKDLHIANWDTGIHFDRCSLMELDFKNVYVYGATIGINITGNATASYEARQLTFEHVALDTTKYGFWFNRVWHSTMVDINSDGANTTAYYCYDCQDLTMIEPYFEGTASPMADLNGKDIQVIGGRNWNKVRIGNAMATSNVYLDLPFGSLVAGSYINISSNAENTKIDLGDNYDDADLTITDNGVGTIITGSKGGVEMHMSNIDFQGKTLTNFTTLRLVSGTGLILNAPFNDYIGSTVTPDSSMQSDDLVVTNAVWNASGGFNGGGAYEFDGVDDYIQASDSSIADFSNTTDFSVSAWIYPAFDASAYAYVLGKHDATNKHYLYYFRLGYIRTEIKDGTNVCGNVDDVSYTQEVWTNVVMVYDAFTHNLTKYVNGEKIAEYDCTAVGDFSNSGKLTIGGLTSTLLFNGSIDNVQIWNRTLTDTEIQNLYEQRVEAQGSWLSRAKGGKLYGNIDLNSNSLIGVHDVNLSGTVHINTANTYAINVTGGNINMQGNKICWNANCSSYTYHNGTHLVQVG